MQALTRKLTNTLEHKLEKEKSEHQTKQPEENKHEKEKKEEEEYIENEENEDAKKKKKSDSPFYSDFFNWQKNSDGKFFDPKKPPKLQFKHILLLSLLGFVGWQAFMEFYNDRNVISYTVALTRHFLFKFARTS